VPVTVWGTGPDASALSEYADVGVDEVCFLLPTQPETESLRALDQLAAVAARFS
jgi:hypothetical protein